jgi:hypothetical protein
MPIKLFFDFEELLVSKLNPLWDEFIVWLRTPPAERGAVATQAEWAAQKGLAERTVRKWKSDARFVARQQELMERFVGVDSDAVTAEVAGESTSETDYLLVKGTLLQQAKGGNAKAIELYFRTYGKPFVDEENASRATDLSVVELEELVSRALLTVGPELVAAGLREQGWTVLGPEGVSVEN